MGVIIRGVKNAFRNMIRTFSIVVILGLSIGLALAMLVARQAVTHKIDSVKSSVANTISISPAGARGFEGGGEPLTADEIAKVGAVAHVTNVTSLLNDRLTTDTSSLTSAIEAGSLGQRNASNNGVSVEFQGPPPSESGTSTSTDGSSTTVVRSFTPPVMLIGTNSLKDATVYGGSSVSYTSGEAFNAEGDENVAVIGKSLAEKNSLSVGSTFTAYSTTIKVVGIFDTGNTFSNNEVLMPLASVQRLTSQTGTISSATATVDSIDNLAAATTAIQSALGTAADVTNQQDVADSSVEPLENIKTISLFSLIGAVVAGAVIILLTMLMIVRERRREIGVLKAIGSSNVRTMVQFVVEAVTLTVLGMVAGIIIGVVAANPITKVLVNNSTSSSTQTVSVRGPGGPAGGFRRFGSNSFTNIKNLQTDVGLSVLAYGAGAAMIIAVLGSAVPALFISKIRPAEVMRAE